VSRSGPRPRSRSRTRRRSSSSAGLCDTAGGVTPSARAAAADAVATDALARADATVLTLFGTGHQAPYEARAITRIRPLSRLLVVGRDPARTDRFVEALWSEGLPAESASAEPAVRAAHIIVTAATATARLFHAGWVQPGTHISSMGSDAPGKQELPPDILRSASLFRDLPEQSLRIGDSSTQATRHIQSPSARCCSVMRRAADMTARSRFRQLGHFAAGPAYGESNP